MEKGLGEMFHALSYCLPNTNLGYISKSEVVQKGRWTRGQLFFTSGQRIGR